MAVDTHYYRVVCITLPLDSRNEKYIYGDRRHDIWSYGCEIERGVLRPIGRVTCLTRDTLPTGILDDVEDFDSGFKGVPPLYLMGGFLSPRVTQGDMKLLHQEVGSGQGYTNEAI